MRLGISNIAWDTAEDESVAALLKRHEVDAIDIAPGKYFPQPDRAESADIRRVKEWWAGKGIEITGMQALLFGTSGLNLFGPPDVQEAMLRHLGAVCRIGGELGATRLVFGSPKNRDRGGLSDGEATAIFIPFFRRLGELAASQGVIVCLEPNPPRYGANFMTTCSETASVVRQVAHPEIRMQFDTGSLTISGEDPEMALQENADLIGHIHASEPDLVPLGDGATDHGRMASVLKARLPDHQVTIEMVATRAEPHPASIERSLGVAIMQYRSSTSRQDK